MCTVTIHRTPNRLLVTMNRDEQRSRIGEKPPFHWDESPIFAPQDTKAGGTWAAINNYGVIACLLNGYHFSDNVSQEQTSRGAIIPAILNAENPFKAAEDMQTIGYASFILYLIDHDKIVEYGWDGKNYNVRTLDNEDWQFFTSSSYAQDQVKQSRYDAFQKWKEQEGIFLANLPSIHSNQSHDNGAFNPLMSREDACTKSITQFDVNKKHKMVRYWSQPYEDLNSYEEFAV